MAVLAATRLRLVWDATSIVWSVAPIVVCLALIFLRRRVDGASGQWPRVPLSACVALLAAQAALALAGNPRTLGLAWEIQWIVAWAASLSWGATEGSFVIRRVLAAGALLDAGLLVGCFTSPVAPGWTSENAFLCNGMALAGALRIGLLPIGAAAIWEKARRSELWAVACLAMIPSAAVLFSRLAQIMATDNNVRLLLVNVIFLSCFPAAVVALATPVSRRRQAWTISTVTGAVAAISLSMPEFSVAVWLVLFGLSALRLAQSLLDSRLDPEIVNAARPTRSMLLAADEWRIPRLWRLAVEMPLRGIAHVARFLDGFLFDQIPRRMSSSVVDRFRPAVDRIPEAVRSRFWSHLALGALVVVLMQALL